MTDYKKLDSGLYVPTDMQATLTESEQAIFDRPSAWSDFGISGSLSTPSGIRVDHTKALSLPAYYACILAISEDIAKLPTILYRRLGGSSKERAIDHPYYKLLRGNPNFFMDNYIFKQVMTAWALGWGNAFAILDVNATSSRIQNVYPIHPSRVPVTGIIVDNNLQQLVYTIYSCGDFVLDSFPYGYVLNTLQVSDREVLYVPADKMLHIKGFGDSPLYGVSGARILADSIGENLASQIFAQTFFGSGLNFGAVLEHPGKLTPEAYAHIKDSFSTYQGPYNANKTKVLEEGMKYQRLAIPPEESQFLQSRQFGIENIARIFRMPLHKIQHLLHATFTNIEQQAIEYVTDTLMSWVVRWEQQLTSKFLSDDLRDEYFVEHLIDAVLRGDSIARANFYKALFNMAALSPDDIREKENMNPIGTEASKSYYLQSGMTTIDRIVAGDNFKRKKRQGAQDSNENINNELELSYNLNQYVNGMK